MKVKVNIHNKTKKTAYFSEKKLKKIMLKLLRNLKINKGTIEWEIYNKEAK